MTLGSDAMNVSALAGSVPARWNAGRGHATSWTCIASDTLARWLAAARSRRSLEELDEHVLRDIGLTREEARREARKFFWQA
jgi:uncharacterized protein YjiS (DUF1127 family)